MTSFKMVLLFLVALLNSAVAYVPWLNVTTTAVATIGAFAAPSPSRAVTTCVTLAGVSNSAILYGTTVSIPDDYDDCFEGDLACWEAGRRCGTFDQGPTAPALTTSSISPTMTTTVILPTTMSAPTETATSAHAETTSADLAANQVADSAAFFAAFAAVLALGMI